MMMMMMMSVLVLNEMLLGHLVTVEIASWSSRLLWISQPLFISNHRHPLPEVNAPGDDPCLGFVFYGCRFVLCDTRLVAATCAVNCIQKNNCQLVNRNAPQQHEWIDFIAISNSVASFSCCWHCCMCFMIGTDQPPDLKLWSLVLCVSDVFRRL